MKHNNIIKAAGMFFLSAGLLASCGGGDNKDQTFTISFEPNGGSAVASITVKYGEKAKKPADPVKLGGTFLGWCVDEALKVDFNWDQEITADWKLYANWSGGSAESSEAGTTEEGTSEEVTTKEVTTQEEVTTEEQPGSAWTMTFIDAAWWNEAAAATAYTLSPAADGKGAYSTTLATYDSVTGYDSVGKTNHWFVEIPAETTQIQFFRVGGTGSADDWGARTVVIDLSARDGKTTWELDSTAVWYGDGKLATGNWVA